MEQKVKYVLVILPLRLKELTYSIPQELESQAKPGSWVYVTVTGRRYLGLISEVDTNPSFDVSKIHPIASIALLNPITSNEIEFWRKIADYYMCSIGEVFRSAYSHEFAKQADVRSRKRLQDSHPAAIDAIPALTEAQQKAREEAESFFKEDKTVLLNGVTGSGKTEIYMHLAASRLKEGKSVLYLVPEIAISRQLQERLDAVFGDMLLIFHSRQTAAQRKEVFQKLSSGAGPHIILGTRSAVFLPLSDVGLVIVDEEHDASYKQDDPAPRYNGRDAALMLASERGANVILGSATPSYEALYNVASGRWSQVSLTEKFHRGPEPEVEMIDMVKARRMHNTKGSFSIKLLNRIAATVEKGEQVMVFRSRRAYSTMLQCTECGHIPKCPNCNVSLSYHKAEATLQCHYCGYRDSFSTRCPSCGEYALKPIGTGTEKIEEELKEYFPDMRIARFDSDTTRSKVQEQKMLKDFASGKIDILVGTQMITKGFDFEKLTLVAVISSDGLLAVQDFRADERAYQLLQQLRGRAGRRNAKGSILIQSDTVSHPLYRRLAGEIPPEDRLAERKIFSYPPFVRLIVITISHKSEGLLWNVCRQMRQAITDCGIKDFTGPVAPAIEHFQDGGIRQFWIKLPRDRRLAVVKRNLYIKVKQILSQFKGAPTIAIDVDPY